VAAANPVRPHEIFTPWYKRARRFPGGLNLLLAFNGVCKLYSKKGDARGRLCARKERERGEDRGRNGNGKKAERTKGEGSDGELDERVRKGKETTHSLAPTQITSDTIFPRLLSYHFNFHFSISRPPGPHFLSLSSPFSSQNEAPPESPRGEGINSVNPPVRDIPSKISRYLRKMRITRRLSIENLRMKSQKPRARREYISAEFRRKGIGESLLNL